MGAQLPLELDRKELKETARLKALTEQVDELDLRGQELALEYQKEPYGIDSGQIRQLIVDTYTTTVALFDEKLSQGEILIQQEEEIYELCKKELDQDQEPIFNSPLGAFFNAIERIRVIIVQVKSWFRLSTKDEKVSLALMQAGFTVLPRYAGIIAAVFTDIIEFFSPPLVPTILGLGAGQLECAVKYQKKRPDSKSVAGNMLNIANYGYEGFSGTSPEEFTSMENEDLPAVLRDSYDSKSGLFTNSKSLKAWLGKKNGAIVIAFSGTDVTVKDMVYTDILQLSAPSVLYLKAAGLVNLMAKQYGLVKIYITGHSLGGGLTQFALTANVNVAGTRLEGYAFNGAGLSFITVGHLEEERLFQAKNLIYHYMTCRDPVSSLGGKIGSLQTLPKSLHNGHGMADLKECMTLYMSSAPVPAPTTRTLKLRYHEETDFVPYTKKLSLMDGLKQYPVFNQSLPLTQASEYAKMEIPAALLDKITFSEKAMDSCLGIYPKFNGNAHTALNRLLLFAYDQPIVTSQGPGDIQSTILFGKFGYGIKDFIPIMNQLYVDSNTYYSISRSEYEKALAYLSNPFSFDKQAWMKGIEIQFGYKLETLFEKNEAAEEYFDQWLLQLTGARSDAYQAIKAEKKPTDKDRKKLIGSITAITSHYSEVLMREAVEYGVITEGQLWGFLSVINRFCDEVKKSY